MAELNSQPTSIQSLYAWHADFVATENAPKIYGNHAMTDIEAIIRRSEIELSDYELKQGCLTLSQQRELDSSVIPKVLKTICAIANNGPNRMGKIVVGVTDKEHDATRIAEIDGIIPRKVGKRYVVGVKREAQWLKISVEKYLSRWKEAIRTSGLSPHLRDSVLSSIDFNDFYGMGVIVITIPPQKELSYLDDQVYWREADSTCKAEKAQQIAAIVKRF